MSEIKLSDYLQKIEGLFEDSRLTEAAAHARHILEQYPRYIDAYRLLAKILLEQHRYEDAADLFQRTLSADPEDFVSYVGLAIVYKELDLPLEAVWHMERAFELEPYNAAIHHELKKLYRLRDGFAPERVQLTEGALARLHFRGQLYQQTAAELRSLLAADSNRPDLEILLVEALWRDRQFIDAGQAAQDLLTRVPDCIKANAILADIWIANGRHEEAQRYLQRLEPLILYAAAHYDQDSAVGHAFAHGVVVLPEQTWLVELDYVPPIQEPEEADLDWVQALSMQGEGEPGSAEEDSWLTAFEPFDDVEQVKQAAADPVEATADFLIPADDAEADLDWLRQVAVGGDALSDPISDDFAPFADDFEDTPDLKADDFNWSDEVEPPVESDAAAEGPAVDELTEDLAPMGAIPDWLVEFTSEGEAEAPGEPGGWTNWLETDGPEIEPDAPKSPAEDTTSENALPDWLQDEFDEIPSAELPRMLESVAQLAEIDDDELPELPDWLEGAVDEPVAQSEDGADLPDWLSEPAVDFSAAESDSDDDWLAAPLSLTVNDDLPDWLTESVADVEDEATESVAEEPVGPSDWQFDEEDDLHDEELALEGSDEEDDKDWLSAPLSLAGNGGELPGWLTEIENREFIAFDDDDAATLDLDDAALGELQPLADEDDWLPETEPTMEEAMTEEPENKKQTELPDDLDDAMVWLERLAADQGAPLDELPSLKADLQQDADEPAADNLADLPEWLQMELDESSEMDLATSESPVPDWLPEESTDDLPDDETILMSAPANWADDLENELAALDEPKLEPGEMPDWLQVSDEDLPPAIDESPPLEEEDLSWLDQIAAGEAEPIGEEPTWNWEDSDPTVAIAGSVSRMEETEDSAADSTTAEMVEADELVAEDLPEEVVTAVVEEKMADDQGETEETLLITAAELMADDEELLPEEDEPAAEEVVAEATDETLIHFPAAASDDEPFVVDTIPEDPDEAMAWLEQLAAQQGAPPEELPTLISAVPAPEEEPDAETDSLDDLFDAYDADEMQPAEALLTDDDWPDSLTMAVPEDQVMDQLWPVEESVPAQPEPEAEMAEDAGDTLAWLDELATEPDDSLEEPAELLSDEAPVADEALDELLASLDMDEDELAEIPPADDDLLDTLLAEAAAEWEVDEIEAPAESAVEDTVISAPSEASEAEAGADIPEDPDEVMAWLEQLAAQQGAPLDELPSIGQGMLSDEATDFFEDTPTHDETVDAAALGDVAQPLPDDFDLDAEIAVVLSAETELSDQFEADEPLLLDPPQLEEVTEADVAGLEYDIPDDPDEAMAWLERLAAQQGAPQAELPSVSDSDYEQARLVAAESPVEPEEVATEPAATEIEGDEEIIWHDSQEALTWLENLALAEGLALDDEALLNFDLPDDEALPPTEIEIDSREATEVDLSEGDEEIDEEEALSWLDDWAAEPEEPHAVEMETPFLEESVEEELPFDVLPEQVEDTDLVVTPEVDFALEEVEAVLDVDVEPEEVAEAVPEMDLAEEMEEEWLEPAAAAEPDLDADLEMSDEELGHTLSDQAIADALPDWLALDTSQSAVEEGIDWLDTLLPDPGEWLTAEEETLHTVPVAHHEPEVSMPEPEAPEESVSDPLGELSAPEPVIQRDAGDELAAARQALATRQVEEAMAAYSDMLQEGHNIRAIIVDLETAVQDQDAAPALQRLLGDAYMRNGQLQKALDVYRHALEGL